VQPAARDDWSETAENRLSALLLSNLTLAQDKPNILVIWYISMSDHLNTSIKTYTFPNRIRNPFRLARALWRLTRDLSRTEDAAIVQIAFAQSRHFARDASSELLHFQPDELISRCACVGPYKRK
jgi:hypothetical protein